MDENIVGSVFECLPEELQNKILKIMEEMIKTQAFQP